MTGRRRMRGWLGWLVALLLEVAGGVLVVYLAVHILTGYW